MGFWQRFSCGRKGQRKEQEERFESISSFSSYSRGSISYETQGILSSPTDNVILTDKAVLKKNVTNGKQFVNNFEILKTLGKGSFAKVKLARDVNTNQYYAIKVMNKSLLKKKRIYIKTQMSNMYESVTSAIELMKQMKGEHLIKLYEIINDSESDKLFLVLDFAEKGASLPGVLETTPLSEQLSKQYFSQLILGLESLHAQNIIHRDIKPENLFIMANGSLKIGDFGAALDYKANPDLIRQSAGTAAFLPPELCTPDEIQFSPPAIDVWASGITLWVYLFGKCPFLGSNIPSTYDAVLHQQLDIPDGVSPQLKDLLLKLLDKDPQSRITVNEIKTHPWLSSDS